MSIPHAHAPTIDAELARRLAVLADPGYDDPARRDLTGLDYLLLAALNVTVTVLMLWYAWG